MHALRRLFFILTFALVGSLAAATFAQEKETAAQPVAVLNLDVLFKEDPQVEKALEELKLEAAEIDEKLKLRQAELESVAADARQAQPGSPEQRRLAQEATKLQGELQQFVARERANVQLKEAKIFLAAYRNAEPVVRNYCREKGIKLVIRQQTTLLEDDQSAQEILKALNRLIVFEEGLDITADIQERMKAKSSQR